MKTPRSIFISDYVGKNHGFCEAQLKETSSKNTEYIRKDLFDTVEAENKELIGRCANRMQEVDILSEDNKELTYAIEDAIRIKDLWLISDDNCPPEHREEAIALDSMEAKFIELLKK